MPRRPASSTFTLSIEDDFDETQNYMVKLDDIEERESQFTDSRKKNSGMAMIHKFNIYRADGTAFLDTQTDGAFELWAWTTDSTFANEKTGKKSKAREYAEALMGRELTNEEVDGMIDSGYREALIGKTAMGSFEVTTTADGNERLNLIKLRPNVPRRQRASATAAAPALSVSRHQDDDDD
jgi:hypothetical protein